MKRIGQVRDFHPKDIGTPIHGWKPEAENLINRRGWAALHVVVQKLIEPKDSELEPTSVDLYDQFIVVENPGSVVVCLAANGEPMCALVQNFRFTAERLPYHGTSGYVAQLAENNRWDELLHLLGEWHWELPRGMTPPSDEQDLRKFILNSAKVETAEETGYVVIQPRLCGRLNANTTFYPHSQYVVVAEIERKQASKPEPFEMIGKATLFSKAQIRAMMGHELVDSFTIAALTLAGFFDM